MGRRKAFSLIELLVVVAIILVLAAIAIPNLVRSRMLANEASAVASLRVICGAEVTFALTYNSGYTDGFNRLGPPPAGGSASVDTADLVDPVLSGNGPGGTNLVFTKNGYAFTYNMGGGGTFGSVNSYSINSDPTTRGSTGQRAFYTDDPRIVRANASTAASASDSPI
jgi:prepilin-type N-terminal cleavage/methylation domain-containing protein